MRLPEDLCGIGLLTEDRDAFPGLDMQFVHGWRPGWRARREMATDARYGWTFYGHLLSDPAPEVEPWAQ
jgi:hypothetical protein